MQWYSQRHYLKDKDITSRRFKWETFFKEKLVEKRKKMMNKKREIYFCDGKFHVI